MWFVFLLLFILLVIFMPLAWGSYLLAPSLPTPQKVVEEMLKLAEVGPEDEVYDLGCGDGRIIIMAAEKFGAKACGFELSTLHFLITKFRIRRSKLSSKVKVIYGNFYKADLSGASVITIFGRSATMPKIKNKLLASLKPETRFVSYAFPIDNLKPQKVL